jgi:hypothetical protein
MFRALAIAITCFWLMTSAAAACEPPPADDATGSTGGVRAQTTDATPTPPSPTDPSACTVEPRSLPELEQLIAEGGRTGEPPSEVTPVAIADLPAGEPADVETIAAITAATEQVMACINAGDFLRLLALFSDNAVRTFASDLGDSPEDLAALSTPEPTPEDEWVTLGEVTAARVLPDGRVGAVIYPAPPNDDDPAFFIFVQVGDRWLVDGFADIDDEGGEVDCCAEPSLTPATTWQPVQGDGYAGVIVPEADGPLFFQSLNGTEPAGYWTPTATEIDQLESNLSMYIYPPPCGDSPAPEQIWQNLETYHRQYAGFVADDGHNLILINAFCDDLGINWQSEPVVVMDGGACFFRLTYDPATGDFFDLRVNGEA